MPQVSFLSSGSGGKPGRCPATTFLWTSAASPLPGCMKPARRKRSISATANGFAVRSRNLKDIEEAFMQALQTVNRISFKNILFLTDFSDASETALAYATGFARHFGAQIFPAHACDPVVLTETAAPIVLDEIEQDSQQRLLQLAKKNSITGTPLFVRGSVESAIPVWIKEHGIDLIVMGTHGRRGLKHFLLGSVAEAVFRSASCPVLTVGPHVTVRPYHDFKGERILFPTDLGPHAEFATQYALSVAQESRAHVTFMHIIPLEE